MMRAQLTTCAAGALTALLASACIDTQLSLGHHSAPSIQDQDAFVPDIQDAAMTPTMTGGQGGGGGPLGGGSGGGFAGGGGSGGADTGGTGGDPSPPPSLCLGALLPMELECQVDDAFMGPPGGATMATTTVLTLIQQPDRPGTADATAVLDFDAFNASFMGRIEGLLDCERGVFRAVIVEGEVSMPGFPPGPFFGELDGMLDPSRNQLDGVWWHGPDIQSGPRCVGTWAASNE